jgi:hypothetical protein
MAKPVRNSLGPLLLYHGCDKDIAELVLAGDLSLIPSENEYDWLGPGIYFWVDSPQRALAWAQQKHKNSPDELKCPSVLGAFSYPGHCLNLTDFGALDELVAAYDKLKILVESQGQSLPSNGAKQHGIYLRRPLDCLVIRSVHTLRSDSDPPLPAYDSIYGIFTEGNELFPGSGFHAKSHAQIAIRNHECIAGYFRVDGYT